jgi:hypothetical protein
MFEMRFPRGEFAFANPPRSHIVRREWAETGGEKWGQAGK